MKKEKLIIFIFALILLIGFVSADSCELKTSCDASKTVLYVYSSTNSHARTSWASGSTTGMLALCCNFVGDKGCNNTNEILSLSSPSNAHAEVPSLTNYGTRVCYGDLECLGTNISSIYNSVNSGYPIKMVSLSSETNAHVGAYNEYPYKIICRHKPSTPPPSNSLSNSNVVFSNNNLNLNPSQLGTNLAKVTIQLLNVNAVAGTPIYLEIYERDLIPSIGGGASGAVISKFDSSETSFLNQIIQSLIQITGKITGRAIVPPNTKNFNYIYTPIRTIKNGGALTGTVYNKEVSFNWIINSSDTDKAGKENSYDFIFKSYINANDNKRYDSNPLKVNINWGVTPPGLNKGKFWLDKDKATKINNKSMNWNDLPSSGGGGGSGTGSVISTITGNVVINENLVYMNASGLNAFSGSIVYFEVWEKDSHEGGLNDSIRTVSASVDNNQNAVASFYINRADIDKMKSEDPINLLDNTAEYELYFKVKNSSNYYYSLPDGTYSLLKLKIIYPAQTYTCGNGVCESNLGENSTNCPQDCQNVSTIYLINAQGMWANNEFTAGITQYVYQNSSSSNVVGMYVSNISPSLNNHDVYFEIWERDDNSASPDNATNDDPIIVGTSLSSSVIGGIANTTWTISSSNLLAAGNETYYEFYFKIRYLSESKSFRNILLNVTVNSSINNSTGGGNYCDDIYYCSDYATESKCGEDPCYDVLENEFALNPEADCSNPNVDCYCYWTFNDECKFSYIRKSSNNLGTCNYVQLGVQDDCENSGVLITSYQATWNWSVGNCYNSSNNCTDAIINAIEESCIQKDGCWRKIDYSYENCTDYEGSTACSSAGGLGDGGLGGEIGSIIKDKKNWWILLIIGILIVGIIIFFVVRKLKKGDIETRLFKTKENFNNILNYIKNARAQNMSESEIRNSLLRVGWTSEQINYAIKKASK